MPYIPHERRNQITRQGSAAVTPGELNYAITTLLTNYLSVLGVDYTHINDALGALEGAKLEFYRRVVAPYEEGKRAQNGDVY